MRSELGISLLEVLVSVILLGIAALGLLTAQLRCAGRFKAAGIALKEPNSLLRQRRALDESNCAVERTGVLCSVTSNNHENYIALFLAEK